MAQLTDVNGKILIDGLDKLVAPVTEDERKIYEKMDFNLVGFFLNFVFVEVIVLMLI